MSSNGDYLQIDIPHHISITEVAVSPNGKYVVTYSEDDDTIVGWNIDKLDPEVSLLSLDLEGVKFHVHEIKISDTKLVLITYWGIPKPDIFQLQKEKNLKISCDFKEVSDSTFDFTQNDKLIVCFRQGEINRVSVYSLPTSKNNELNLESMYEVYCDDELSKLGITNDKTDKMWATSNHYFYSWDLNDTSNKIEYCYSYKLLYPQYAEVSVNGDKILVCDTEKIFILKNKHNSPIRYIKTALEETKAKLVSNKFLLVFEDEVLEDEEENEKKEGNEKKGDDHILLYDINDNIQVEMESLENGFIIYDYNSQTNKAYGITNNDRNKILTIEFKDDQSWEKYFKEKGFASGWNIYSDDVYESNDDCYYENEFRKSESIKIIEINEKFLDPKFLDRDHTYKWSSKKNVIKVKKKNPKNEEWSSVCKKVIYDNPEKSFLLNENVLALFFDGIRKTRKSSKKQPKQPKKSDSMLSLLPFGLSKPSKHPKFRLLAIFKFDSKKKDIQLQYFGHHSSYDDIGKEFKFFKNDLPYFGYLKDISNYNNSIDKLVKMSSNYDYRLEREWLDVVATDDFALSKYGKEYFRVFIGNGASKHIAKTYDTCINNIKNDTKNDIKKILNFLNVITTSIAELVHKYPDYLERFNSDMFILLDPAEKRRVKSHDQHLYSYDKKFECVQISHNFLSYFLKYLKVAYNFPKNAYYFLSPPKDDYSEYVILISSYNNFSCYPEDYSWWKELFYKPKSSIFVNTCERGFYDNWNGEAIVNFKWRKFGRYYYFLIWLKFMAFSSCFIIGSLPRSNSESRDKLYQATIILGLSHLLFEIRQLTWNPQNYILTIWNYFDSSAYVLPIYASFYWLYNMNHAHNWIIPVACLLLCMKFLLFFRAFESFGVYYAITFGVARRVFSFLVILVIIIASFALSFHLLLYPQNFNDSLSTPNFNDPNNPWTLSPTYNRKFKNGSIDSSSTLIQTPDESTNMFASYHAALLAMYLFLTGDTESLSPWPTSAENALMITLLVIFSFLIVVYLMNLFIGLLNMEIERYNDRASYLAQKAEILIEIELFYLLPFQRRWDDWFPEVIRYYARADEASNYIEKAIKDERWNPDDFPEYKDKVLKLFGR